MSKNKTMLDEALHYADLGFSVFPCHSIKNGVCTCGDKFCKFPGAHQRVDYAFKNATTDEGVLRKYWKKWPDSNIGFPTGKISNLVAIEIHTNPGKKFEDILYELYQKGFGLPLYSVGSYVNSTMAKTGEFIEKKNHIYQLYYMYIGHTLNSIDRILESKTIKKMDLKADGGFTILPPSIHSTGASYEWDIPFGEWAYLISLPTWIIELASQGKRINISNIKT